MRRFHRLFLFLGFIAVAVFMSIPALAEFDSERQTAWGVQTKGNSNTIGQWAALAWEVDQVDGTIFIGGNYLEVTNGSQVHSQPYLSAYDADTGAWQSWFRPAIGSAVFALQPTPDGGLLVGGEIGSWNGQTVGSLVKIDPATGDRWPGFPTRVFGGNSVVRDLKLEADGFVYAVGNFPLANEGAGSFDVGGAIRFDPISGQIDNTWTPQIESGAAWGVSRSKTQDVTYIAGFFQSVDGNTAARGFVGVDDTGAIVTDRNAVPYNGCEQWAYCSQMYDVEATEAGHLWVGGVEHALYVIDETDGSLVRQHYTACNPALQDCNGLNWVGGEFQEIERVGSRIYAGCHCWNDLYSDTQLIAHRFPTGEHNTVKAVAAFDATTTDVITSFAPELRGDSGAFGIHQNPVDGCLWVTGGFTSYGSPGGPQPASHDVVRICDEAGPGPAAGPAAIPPVPTLCTAVADPANSTYVAIAWTSTESSIGTIIYRSVNGATAFWAGRVNPPADSLFNATAIDNKSSEFFVRHVYPGGQRSELTSCGVVDLQPNLSPATQCTVAVGANDEAIVDWIAGTDNADYIVRRSVDGGTNYWRARVDGTTYTDTAIVTGRTYVFSIEARDAAGSVAAATPCAPSILIQNPQPDAVASCSASVLADNTISLVWPDGNANDRYIVRRSVNGSTNYWRARVDSAGGGGNLSYLDTAIEVGKIYAFSVESIGVDGTITAATACNPSPIEIAAPPVAPVLSCTLVSIAGAYELDWQYADPANQTEVIVERARDDVGTYGWRARVSGTSFADDRVQPSLTYSYRVRAIGADGTRSDPTACS